MRLRFFNLIFLPLLLWGCVLEAVESYPADKITIASDFLTPQDTVLFTDFTANTGIHIEITQMSADLLIGVLRKSRFNSGIDLIMIQSLYDVNRLNKIGAYQPLSAEAATHFGLTEYNVYPVGIDPFIIVAQSDSVMKRNISYSDLENYRGRNTLSHEDYVTFMSNWYTDEDPVVAKGKIRSYSLKLKETGTILSNDSIDYLLMGQNQYESLRHDSLYRQFKHTIQPVENEKGVFFNLFTIGILNQADDYFLANKFIEYINSTENNKRIAQDLHLIPVNGQQQKKYSPIGENLQFFTNIERTIAH